jgi:hypothetical protein
MLGSEFVKQRLTDVLRDVEPDASLKGVRYIEEVKSWEIEVEARSGVRVGRIPEEWFEDETDERLFNRLFGLLLKERPDRKS